MAGVSDVVAEARAVGLDIRAEAGYLVVRGPRSLDNLARRLLERKGEVLELLAMEDAEVAWRAAAMRPQVPPRGPIPFLVAANTSTSIFAIPGVCASCGLLPAEARGFRCAACTKAVSVVLHEIREGVAP